MKHCKPHKLSDEAAEAIKYMVHRSTEIFERAQYRLDWMVIGFILFIHHLGQQDFSGSLIAASLFCFFGFLWTVSRRAKKALKKASEELIDNIQAVCNCDEEE